MDKQITRADILMSGKEVFETSDMDKAAQMLQSGDWIAICAAYKPSLTFALIRVKDAANG